MEIEKNTEALLYFIHLYRAAGSSINISNLWGEVCDAKRIKKYDFYPFSNYDPKIADFRMLSDVADLLSTGAIYMEKDNTIEITSEGKAYARNMEMPEDLLPTEDHPSDEKKTA